MKYDNISDWQGWCIDEASWSHVSSLRLGSQVSTKVNLLCSCRWIQGCHLSHTKMCCTLAPSCLPTTTSTIPVLLKSQSSHYTCIKGKRLSLLFPRSKLYPFSSWSTRKDISACAAVPFHAHKIRCWDFHVFIQYINLLIEPCLRVIILINYRWLLRAL